MEVAGLSQFSLDACARGEHFVLAEPPAKLMLDTVPASVLGQLPDTAATAPGLRSASIPPSCQLGMLSPAYSQVK